MGDVDLRERCVTVRLTKNHRAHELPIGSWLAGLLAQRKALFASAYVFPAENAAGHLKNHLKSVQAIAAKSGVEFRLHDVRRTFASIVNH